MKLILTILFTYVVSTLAAQKDTIPKNADTFIIKEVSFSDIANRLLDSGFVLDKVDREFGSINTVFRDLCSDCIPQLRLNVRVKDSVATITGIWKTSGNLLQLGLLILTKIRHIHSPSKTKKLLCQENALIQ